MSVIFYTKDTTQQKDSKIVSFWLRLLILVKIISQWSN